MLSQASASKSLVARVKLPPVSHSSAAPSRQTSVHGQGDVVPDSEEERVAEELLRQSEEEAEDKPRKVIVISSDEEDEPTKENHDHSLDDPFAIAMPGTWPTNKRDARAASIATSDNLSRVRATPKKKFPPARRIVESSDSADDTCLNSNNNDIVELTDSDSEKDEMPRSKPTAVNISKSRSGKAKEKAAAFPSPKVPLYEDDEDDEVYTHPLPDEAILILNEPRNLRKTIPLQQSISHNLEPFSPSSSPKKDGSGKTGSGSVSVSLDVQLTPLSVSNTSPSKRKPRIGKKAAAAAKLEELKAYAQGFFDELNASVFDSGIPATTQLIWNNRMTTTAGKASYHRSRDGVSTSNIELAIKILDNEDRIRRTLSHEMCHLACWIISGKMNENHGSVFKGWAAKVHSIRPDIVVSTTHDYEINYTYRWRCQQCSLEYGRFSNSINPEKVGCAACNGGRLEPLFSVKTRKSTQTPKASRMAASKPRDSPSSISRPSYGQPRPSSEDEVQVTCIHDTDSDHDPADSDIELITTTLDSTSITAS